VKQSLSSPCRVGVDILFNSFQVGCHPLNLCIKFRNLRIELGGSLGGIVLQESQAPILYCSKTHIPHVPQSRSRSQLQSHNLGLAVDVGYHRHHRRPLLLLLGGSNEAALRLNDLLKGRPHLFHRDVFQVPFQQRQLDVLEPAFPVGRRSF
jgi:hypothetical protein